MQLPLSYIEDLRIDVSNLLVQAPVVGHWSDAYGRKPFLILSFACGGAQVFVLLLYITRGTSLLWYFPAQACSSPPGPFLVQLVLQAHSLAIAQVGKYEVLSIGVIVNLWCWL